MSDADTPLDAARLTKVYRKIRDAKSQLASDFKKKEAELDEQLREVELLLLKEIERTGGTGLSNEHGTVSRRIKQTFWSSDWEEFKKFVKHYDALDLFEHRIAQKNMADFIAKNPTKIPVGLQVDRKYVVHVVKPRTKPE